MINTNYLQIISSTINLKGYSSSLKWKGYYQKKEGLPLNKSMITECIKILISYFNDNFDDFIIANSYYIDSNKLSDKDNKLERYVIEAEKFLIEKDYISIFDFSTFFDYESQDKFDEQVDEIEKEFKFINATVELINKFSIMGMCDSHLGYQDGHCFFISIDKNIIFYPHEDTGFGFFVIDENKDSILNDFLDIVKKTQRFEIFIKE